MAGSTDKVEVRLLGPLHVVRPDGRPVQQHDRCRPYLASTQGADPSLLTSAVHVQILAGPRHDVR